jgi:hypothetical protein
MLLTNVKKMSKNYIIFMDPQTKTSYYQHINDDNKLNVFNKDLMNILLDQFSETINRITYNDITHISILQNHDATINNLPNKLNTLTIISSMCSSIEFIGEVCENIEFIYIDKSNITNFPDISRCNKLKICKINHSAINRFDIEYDLPNTLFELNLQSNLITNTDFAYNKLEDKMNKTLKKISFSDNYLIYDEFPENLARKCNLIRQQKYIHNVINFINVANVNINNYVQETLENQRNYINYINHINEPNHINEQNEQNEPNHINQQNYTRHGLFSSQNVHLSSINQSILKSVELLQDYVYTNNITVEKLELIEKNSLFGYINNIITFYKEHKDNDIFLKYYTTNNINLKHEFNTITTNSITRLTYKETFELIWAVVCDKYRKNEINIEDAFERIVTEVNDGKLMCFTGKYNRLINSMVGIIEGLHVGFSEGEELQLEFGNIIEKFAKNNNNYTFENLYCDSKSILDNIRNNETKQAWLTAIMDLEPDPVKITYDNNVYYLTWDKFILSSREKDIIGYQDENDNIYFLESVDESESDFKNPF